MDDATITLWDHQNDALQQLREARSREKTRLVLQAPPGAGKTEIGTEVIKSARAKGRSVAFTVPMLTLVDQTVKRFEARGVPPEDIGVIQANHPRTNEIAPVQVVSVQTLNNRPFPLADVVIVDEAHIQYKRIREWIAACPEITFIGLSATPWARGMKDYWEELIVVETIRGLIDKKVLSPFRTFAPPQRANLSGVAIDSKTEDYAIGQLSDVMQEKRLVADVVQTWLGKAMGRPTLCFAVDRAHAAKLTDQFQAMGIKAQYVDALTERDERAVYIEQLRTGEVQVIVSIGTMTTGVDIPWVTCVSYVRPTRSEMLFVQSICRGLRAYEGKADCLILDHSMTTERLGLVSDIGFSELRGGKTSKSEAVSRETPIRLPRECPSCHYMISPTQRRCPECGFAPQIQSHIENEDGELVEYGTSPKEKAKAALNKEWSFEQKARFYGGLRWFGEFKGYKPGWAAMKYKERFGVWPNDPRVKYAPVFAADRETLAWIAGEIANYVKGLMKKRA